MSRSRSIGPAERFCMSTSGSVGVAERFYASTDGSGGPAARLCVSRSGCVVLAEPFATILGSIANSVPIGSKRIPTDGLGASKKQVLA